MRLWAWALLAGSIGLAACEPNPDFDLPGATGPLPSDPAAAVQVGNLSALWQTPNQIRWSWDATGAGDQLFEFELVTGPSQQAVRERSGEATVWTSAQNPELGRFFLPRTGGEDPVVATTTDDHPPDTPVFAQLTSIDSAGRASVTEIAATRTTVAATDEIVVFADVEPDGIPIPDTFVLATNDPFAGSSHYEFNSTCTDSAACWENLRRQEMSIDVSAISAGNYRTTAFVEFALQSNAQVGGWWASVWLQYDGSCVDCIGFYNAWTVRADGEYHVLQVPLRVFEAQAGPVPYEELALGLWGFSVGAEWEDGATIRVDEIRLRW